MPFLAISGVFGRSFGSFKLSRQGSDCSTLAGDGFPVGHRPAVAPCCGLEWLRKWGPFLPMLPLRWHAGAGVSGTVSGNTLGWPGLLVLLGRYLGMTEYHPR